MTFEQASIIAILLAMLVAYATERFRIELVALVGLGAAFLFGLVPVQQVFAGFSSPAVITVVEVLLVVAALSRTRVVDNFARRIVHHAKGERAVLAVVCFTGAFVSIFMNNIGALALLFPVAMSVCARLDLPPARVLMPLSFATLLGGMCSLTGTPANLIVNEWLIGETGRGFGYFELALLGGPLAIAGLLWIVVASPRIFARFTEVHSTSAVSPTWTGTLLVSVSSCRGIIPHTWPENTAYDQILRKASAYFAHAEFDRPFKRGTGCLPPVPLVSLKNDVQTIGYTAGGAGPFILHVAPMGPSHRGSGDRGLHQLQIRRVKPNRKLAIPIHPGRKGRSATHLPKQ